MRTLHDAWVAACGRKTAYEDLSRAEALAAQLSKQSPFGELLTVYRCPFAPLGEGGHFHVGHVRGTKPKPDMLAAKRRWSAPKIAFTGTLDGESPGVLQAPRKPRAKARKRPNA